jgi:aminotransferase
MIICAPAISQMAAEAGVREAWSYPLSFHDEFRRRRAVLAAGLGKIPPLRWTPTRAGLFAFARVDGCSHSAALSSDLLERAHVVTIPGAAFGASGEGYLRLSYGYADAAELAEAADRLRRFFART